MKAAQLHFGQSQFDLQLSMVDLLAAPSAEELLAQCPDQLSQPIQLATVMLLAAKQALVLALPGLPFGQKCFALWHYI
jgi:hypothetical protein